MQKKKRISKTLVFVTIVSTILLFILVSCNGRWTHGQGNSGSTTQDPGNPYPDKNFPYKSSPVIGWMTKYKELNFDSIKDFIANEKIKNIKLIGESGNIFVVKLDGVTGVERPPCGKYSDTIIDPIPSLDECRIVKAGRAVVGFELEMILKTEGSPYCVTENIGGYIFEYDIRTGGPCL